MTSSEPWYANFFSGLIVEAQRHMYNGAQTDHEARFLFEELGLPAGSKVLDVPCGMGRLSLSLAQKGLALTGIDFAAETIAEARQAVRASGLPVRLVQCDMRDLPWENEFAGAFCFGNSFGYFDEKENLRFLQSVHRSLLPGGCFILETHLVAESIFPRQQRKRWFNFGDFICLHDTRYDPFAARQISSYILMKDGKTESKEAHYCVLTGKQLLAMFADAGFKVEQIYGSTTRAPFELGSEGMWVKARKSC